MSRSPLRGSAFLSVSRRLVLVLCLLAATAVAAVAVVGAAAAAERQPKSLAASQPGRDGEHETPALLKADAVLPPELRSGPLFRVEPEVQNDGYMNVYHVRSKFGDYAVTGTDLLRERIHEFSAMAKMDERSGGAEFGSSLAESGKDVVKGAADLVTKPVKTLGNALSGVGKIFVRAEEALIESKPSKYEDNAVKSVIGVSKARREVAGAYGVDPYTTNAALVERLDRLTGANYAGGLVVTGASAAVPGGVGWAVSGAKSAKWLEDVDAAAPPADLRRADREALLAMGMNKDLVTAFIDNGEFSPLQQALLVSALKSMSGTRGREKAIIFAASTANEEQARFRLGLTRMLAGYNHVVAPLARLEKPGRFPVGVRSDGGVVVCFPLDYLCWTRTAAAVARDFAESLRAAGGRPGRVEMYLTGQASPMAARNLRALGFTLVENAGPRLFGVAR